MTTNLCIFSNDKSMSRSAGNNYILCIFHTSMISDLDWLSWCIWYKFPLRFWALCITSMLVVMPKKVLRFGCYQGGITPWLICVVYTMVIPKHKTFYSISIFISQQPCLRYCWPILATRVHANFLFWTYDFKINNWKSNACSTLEIIYHFWIL